MQSLKLPALNALVADWRQHLAKNTANTYRTALNNFLRFVREKDGPDLVGKIDTAPQGDARIETFTQSEIEQVIAAASIPMRLLILLALDTGMRWSTILSITRESWNSHAGTLTFQTKGQHNMTLPATPRLAEFLNVAVQSAGPGESLVRHLFARPDGKAVSNDLIRKTWERLRSHTNIRTAMRPHDFRRTAATNLYQQTKDLRAVQQFLGHKSLMSTVRYIAPHDPGELRKLLNSAAIPFSMRRKP